MGALGEDGVELIERGLPDAEVVGTVGRGGGERRWGARALGVAAVLAAALFGALAASAYGGGGGCDDEDGSSGSEDTTPRGAPAETARGSNGAVAADHPLCSELGLEVLRDGGVAADAAVTTALCLGVCRPDSSGIGGGAFVVVVPANGSRAEAIDAREVAPAGATERMFVGDPDLSITGGLAVAVPGELKGLRLLWERHGLLPWSRLVLPAARLADGCEVDGHLADSIDDEVDDIALYPATAAVYTPGGRPLREGDTLRNPALAETLRAIARDGPRVLYEGSGAEAIAADARAAGGVLTAEDLSSYEPKVREPVRSELMGMTFYGMPPPSSGAATVLQILRLLHGYTMPLTAAGEGLAAHRIVEAFKHAFAMRMNLADPDFVDVAPVVDAMLSQSFNDELRANTSDTHTLPTTAYGGRFNVVDRPLPEDHGTTHLSVLDAEGNAVAMTSTVNTAFGSKVMSASTGVLLNNEMDDFSSPGQENDYGLAPSVANFIKPGKRPLSSMSPTVVLQDGKVRAVVGASGGPRIITGVAQTLIRLLLLAHEPFAAVKAPRLHHQLLPDLARTEHRHLWVDNTWNNVSDAVESSLRRRGHDVHRWKTAATVQLVVRDPETGELTAVSDRRKGGRPAAY